LYSNFEVDGNISLAKINASILSISIEGNNDNIFISLCDGIYFSASYGSTKT